MTKSMKASEEKPRTALRIGTALLLLLPLLFLLPQAGAGEMATWDSGDLAQNETWSHTFMMETNDMYSCTPHPPNVYSDFTGWVNVSNDADATAYNLTIYIDDFSYSDRDVKIKPGVTVTWVNNDTAVHTATQLDMGTGGDDHDHMEDEDTPGFAFGLAFAALTIASVVATRRQKR